MSRLRKCLAALKTSWRTRNWLRRRLDSNPETILGHRNSGGRYANGNHIHGSSSRDDLLARGGTSGGRTDFRTSVPPVLCAGQNRTAGGGCKSGAQALSRKTNSSAQLRAWDEPRSHSSMRSAQRLIEKENDDAGVEVLADVCWPRDDSRGCKHSGV